MISQLIPHQGAMCLLDRIVEFDDIRIVAASRSHRRTDNPLRRGDRLPGLMLCEYGAQAMALHGGLIAHRHGAVARPGMLVALRDVHLMCDTVESIADELLVRAERLIESAGSLQYSFEVSAAGVVLARGRAAVITRPA